MLTNTDSFPEFEARMRQARSTDAAIQAFRNSYQNLRSGQTGMIPEAAIAPVAALPHLADVPRSQAAAPELLAQTVVVKLNGGLGTSMGLERAKSLLVVKNGLTFLDFIVRQVLFLRERYQAPVGFLLMNSFSTSHDTLEFLGRYPGLGDPRTLELMQSQVPKVDARTFRPAAWPANPQLEWCPPGHGDIYPSLLGSGLLERYLRQGIKFLFVSNADNLGASLDLGLLKYFADSGKSFLMEVAIRTSSDKKGGHLAQRGDKLLLRESAQCPEADLAAFQDIAKHRFFNTNNLWIRLDALQAALDANRGFVPLPLIKNSKTVDPRDKSSTPVLQLETAMGAAIEYFEDSGAMVVPRTRFAPVKTTSDLFALRSDAYLVTEDWRVLLANGDAGGPPKIDLDDNFKLVDQLDARTPQGVPSLKDCRELVVRGPVAFGRDVILRGKVTVSNTAADSRALPAGEYQDQSVNL
jgi:UDP-N-acetylglucosamine pyrophosphorylase